MHETDDTYLIRSTWSFYWLDQFLTFACNTWISSELNMFRWTCLLFILLILVGAELPWCMVVQGRMMICTSVIPWLSSGFAKNDKIISMFVLVSWLFVHFENLAFFENGGTNLTSKQSNRMFLVSFSKVQLSKNFLKNCSYSD